MSNIAYFVASFREAAPYIQYLRGKTMVVGVTDSLLEGETLIRLAADLEPVGQLGLAFSLGARFAAFARQIGFGSEFCSEIQRQPTDYR